ncbi:thiamine-phosphate kinase [Ottowia sp.]|mgnify:CR=1 FL=1|uniref:thiamine-phosphate kinase n=1 Tax=Ottowia sp. TaxID=1898956 RepID=UPI002B6EEB82|nr:thiamine-phosphate kinase [Ottowia sp.]HOB66349.1 thiamine-phosphate kinase [Ottowia sp.]HPZ58502.1 thiamine-phosphate kinase [Ottowia sp.]HQD47381.1 thiamine-phosphate kinase [Ottowia sp.]
MGEFELIERFFKRKEAPAPDGQAQPAIHSIALGIGDDCALLQPKPGMQLAISTDMLVEGRHFFADVDPEALGHKALAVNLSDLAACGAEPLACTLALALPPERAADEAWLAAFACGLFALADAHGCALIGGDTTAGPLNLCITVFGQVPLTQALRRDGAQVGDDVWVSGTLGDARLALGALRGEWALPPDVLAAARQRLERPTPRVALGLALRGIASAAADVSDGLAGDLGHILQASGAGAAIDRESASHLIAARAFLSSAGGPFDAERRLTLVLTGGDDYELVFTAPPAARTAVQAAGEQAATPVTRIGRIEAEPGLRLIDAHGQTTPWAARAFDHFA